MIQTVMIRPLRRPRTPAACDADGGLEMSLEVVRHPRRRRGRSALLGRLAVPIPSSTSSDNRRSARACEMAPASIAAGSVRMWRRLNFSGVRIVHSIGGRRRRTSGAGIIASGSVAVVIGHRDIEYHGDQIPHAVCHG